ncbi:MAG: glycosyltransferase family 9 protein [Micavibrio sp.]
MQENILVIKLSALGDFIQALGAMAAIRAHHKTAHITLLTTAPYRKLAEQSGYFDAVMIDSRPQWNKPRAWMDLRRRLNAGKFQRVYDLQNNDRTSFYLRLLSPRPEWVGTARGATHRCKDLSRKKGKAFDRHAKMLKSAGVGPVRPDAMEWVKPEHDFSHLAAPYILIVPGASPQHPEKRWPQNHYVEFCDKICASGYMPVIIGSAHEAEIARHLCEKIPQAKNLTAQTSIFDLPALARGAVGVVGNDTGPMHIIAQAGCPAIVLFSNASDPARHAPLGGNVITIQKDRLEDLDPERVWRAFKLQHSLA